MSSFSPSGAGGSVQDSPELDRILSIPRRTWTPAELLTLSADMTAALKTANGTQTLRPIQALALLEIGKWRGAFLPIRTGGGKTLLSLLAPRMVPSARPLLLVPAHLREKTRDELAGYRKDWVLPKFIKIMSYQTLSTVANAAALDDYRPDFIFCDEAHYLKNTSAACTARVSRYMKEQYGKVPFVVASGTLTKRSIRDFAHLGNWSLRERNPVPQDWNALDEWSRALDVNVNAQRRLMPGALSRLRNSPIEPIRSAFKRRLVDTPGVVATQDKPLPIPLTFESHLMHYPSPHWSMLRDDGMTPDGWECMDGIEIWRHARELSIGCWYRWDPRPPTEWSMARSAWGRLCREILKTNRRNLDSELQVVMAVQAGHYPHAEAIYADWKAIEPTFTPNVEAVWESDHAIEWIRDWIAKGPGIVWVSHRFLGERLADMGVLPYYSNGGLCTKTGRAIEQADPTKAIAASIAANSTGRNLQMFNRNLIVGVPPNGSIFEQLISRTHRDGQTAAAVSVEMLFGCVEDVSAFWRAVEDSKYAEAMTGQAQKLCHSALTSVADPDIVSAHCTAQWVR